MAKTKKDPNKKPPSNRKLEKAQDKLSKSTKNFDEVLVNQQQANQNSDGSALKKYKEKVKQGKKQLRFDKNKEKQRKKEEERRSGERGKIGENKEAHNLRLRQEAEKRRKGEEAPSNRQKRRNGEKKIGNAVWGTRVRG